MAAHPGSGFEPADSSPDASGGTAAPAGGRLWFYLDDVLPLAEHAAGTIRHTLTPAQLVAHAPLTQALAWTGQGRGDTLASNGEPGWHDATGQPHTARAVYRLHTATATPAPAVPAARRSGYLPLHAVNSDGVRVIDWLRHAAARGGHWLRLDIRHAHPRISRDRLAVTAQHSDPYPADAIWTPATVACVPQPGSGRYRALVAENYLSMAGGQIARFDRATIDRIIHDLDQVRLAPDYQPGWHAILRWAGPRLQVFEEHPAGFPRWRRRDVVGPDRDGRYPLGTFLWTWLRTYPS